MVIYNLFNLYITKSVRSIIKVLLFGLYSYYGFLVLHGKTLSVYSYIFMHVFTIYHLFVLSVEITRLMQIGAKISYWLLVFSYLLKMIYNYYARNKYVRLVYVLLKKYKRLIIQNSIVNKTIKYVLF